MKRPKFEPIFQNFSEICEVSEETPIVDFIPNQAITLKELVTRFEKGQRLNVHSNFAPGSNFENISDEQAMEQIKNESMDSDDFPPAGVYDIADVEHHYSEHNAHKREFVARKKKEQEEAKQAKQRAAQQATDPTPAPPVD